MIFTMIDTGTFICEIRNSTGIANGNSKLMKYVTTLTATAPGSTGIAIAPSAVFPVGSLPYEVLPTAILYAKATITSSSYGAGGINGVAFAELINPVINTGTNSINFTIIVHDYNAPAGTNTYDVLVEIDTYFQNNY
jgi:hypothetical protein